MSSCVPAFAAAGAVGNGASQRLASGFTEQKPLAAVSRCYPALWEIDPILVAQFAGDHVMLTARQIATVCAALLYWQEEMCPHSRIAMRPYFQALDLEISRPLSSAEITRLIRRLKDSAR